jgi:hypothetical protein
MAIIAQEIFVTAVCRRIFDSFTLETREAHLTLGPRTVEHSLVWVRAGFSLVRFTRWVSCWLLAERWQAKTDTRCEGVTADESSVQELLSNRLEAVEPVEGGHWAFALAADSWRGTGTRGDERLPSSCRRASHRSTIGTERVIKTCVCEREPLHHQWVNAMATVALPSVSWLGEA